MRVLVWILLVVTSSCCLPVSHGGGVDYSFAGRGSVEAIGNLAARILQQSPREIAERFLFDICTNSTSSAPGWFELRDTLDGKVQITGASGPDVAYGLSWYLRTTYNASFSWNRTGGHHVNVKALRANVRPVGDVIRKERSTPISYFNNVVTFSYSYVWYQFREWEYLLDWMALCGINLALSYTGQEEVYRKTFNEYGIDDETFSGWVNGIAYLAWSRGQNLHGCSGGLPLKVMKSQWMLQKRILRRMKELGIVAVLPTFQGNLPSAFRTLYPHANISESGIAWLDGTDPLFADIQSTFMNIMIKDWGTDHWYETDGYFNHEDSPWFRSSETVSVDYGKGNQYCRYNTPPDNVTQNVVHIDAVPGNKTTHKWMPMDSDAEIDVDTDLVAKNHSTAVFESMRLVDPNAVWLYQGWVWRGFGKNHLPYVKGFVSGVPQGRFVILDMFDEVMPEWNLFDNFAYFDTPFIWSTLHNFGGNTGMWGSLELLNREPFKALEYASSSMVGTGGAPEGIDHNPIYYSLLTDIHWRSEPFSSTQAYIDRWTVQRYGFDSENAKAAWSILANTVYGDETNAKITKQRDFLSEKNEDGITALPGGYYFKKVSPIWYNVLSVQKAWQLLVLAGKEHREQYGNTTAFSRPFRYDLVNLGREVLAKLSIPFFSKMIDSNRTEAEMKKAGNKLLRLTLDADSLLCTETSFMAKPWFDMAAALAKSIDPQDDELLQSFLLQARSQTTTWGPQAFDSQRPDSTNLDYANKQWGGQLSGFYALRNRCWIKYPKNQSSFEACVANVSYSWTHDITETHYPMCGPEPAGDTLEISRSLLNRWCPSTVFDVAGVAT